MRFESKRDWWLGLVIWLPFIAAIIGTGYSAIVEKEIIPAIIIIPVMGFVAWIWFGTYYIIEDKHLLVRCGPIKEKIAYADIKSMKETNSPLSSSALSIDRIEIRHKKFGLTLISPLEKELFIKEIGKKCSGVIVKRKR